MEKQKKKQKWPYSWYKNKNKLSQCVEWIIQSSRYDPFHLQRKSQKKSFPPERQRHIYTYKDTYDKRERVKNILKHKYHIMSAMSILYHFKLIIQTKG
jgi:hypothetical protein